MSDSQLPWHAWRPLFPGSERKFEDPLSNHYRYLTPACDDVEVYLTGGVYTKLDQKGLSIVQSVDGYLEAHYDDTIKSHYIRVCIATHVYMKLTRLLYGLDLNNPDHDKYVINHIGGSTTTTDNRYNNLEPTDVKGNNNDKKKYKNNASGMNGVSHRVSQKRFQVKVREDNKERREYFSYIPPCRKTIHTRHYKSETEAEYAAWTWRFAWNLLNNCKNGIRDA